MRAGSGKGPLDVVKCLIDDGADINDKDNESCKCHNIIIFDDCDIDQAVNGAAFATFVASGQTCIMGARLLIHETVFDRFMTKLVDKVKSIRLGDPMSLDTQMGPVISQASLQRISVMVDHAVSQGAIVRTGGTKPTLSPPFDKGSYYMPTVLEVKTSMEIWREEVFGPVVVATKFSTERDAIDLANDSPYGLAGTLDESIATLC